MDKIKSFTDLIAWQEGHKLVLLIYQTTKKFPSKEAYALADQLRRCSLSITSNIAEGFSRKGHKEKLQFYYMALGSLTELQNQILVARDLSYIDKKIFTDIADLSINVSKLLNGLIKYLKTPNT